MNNHQKLNKIPLDDYNKPGCQYADTKRLNMETFERYFNEGCDIVSAIAGTFHNNMNISIEENGMEKFVAIISAVLFSLQHEENDNQYFKDVTEDICDFETGEYDDLFTQSDLKLIKKDIAFIKSQKVA